MALSKQEIFTKAFTALRERGFTRAMGYDPSLERYVCVYRSSNGPCAIGLFITDEEYRPEMEGKTAYGVIRDFGVAALKFEDDVSPVTQDDLMQFLQALQGCHDEGNTPARMEYMLRGFANLHSLEVPA